MSSCATITRPSAAGAVTIPVTWNAREFPVAAVPWPVRATVTVTAVATLSRRRRRVVVMRRVCAGACRGVFARAQASRLDCPRPATTDCRRLRCNKDRSRGAVQTATAGRTQCLDTSHSSPHVRSTRRRAVLPRRHQHSPSDPAASCRPPRHPAAPAPIVHDGRPSRSPATTR